MILHFAILLAFQLLGEAVSRTLLPFAPGPVIGFALLVLALAIWRAEDTSVRINLTDSDRDVSKI